MGRAANVAIAAMTCLTVLSACGGLADRTTERELSAWLQTLDKGQQRGEGGSVEGYLYLFLPGPPTPLRDWSVTLIPLPPTLEHTVARAREQFIGSGRIPLTTEALAQARRPIDDYMKALAATGHAGLIRTVKTETGTDPKFAFQDLPPGRWLLLAEFPSNISVLLWTVPVTVMPGERTWQSLNDKSLWLEGLASQQP